MEAQWPYREYDSKPGSSDTAVRRQLIRVIADMHADVTALAKDNAQLHKMNSRLLILVYVTMVILLGVTLPFAINFITGV